MQGVIILDVIEKRLILIHHCRGATWNVINKSFQFDPSFKAVFSLNIDQLVQMFQMKTTRAKAIYVMTICILSYSDQLILQLKNKQIVAFSLIFSPYFLPFLKEIYGIPHGYFIVKVIFIAYTKKICSPSLGLEHSDCLQ